MLASIVLLAVAFLAVLAVAGMVWFDVASGNAARIVQQRQEFGRTWRPPYARGKDLVNWARETSSQVVGKWLAKGRNAGSPGDLAAELHRGATRAMVPLVSEPEAECRIACPDEGQGMIRLTIPEVLEIADYIQHNLPRAERNRIRDLAWENAKKLADSGHKQFVAPETPCPLQGENRVCRVYEARPLHCRPLHMATIARRLGLEVATEGGEDLASAPHEQSVEQGVEEGVTRSLESAGLDAHLYELNSALVAALDTPNAAQRWMQGEDIFAQCKIAS